MSSTITAETTEVAQPELSLPALSPTSPFGDPLADFVADNNTAIATSAASNASSSKDKVASSSSAGGLSSPPTFLDSPPSPSCLPPPYATNNPFTKASKLSRPTPLGYVPPPTPLASRRNKSIVLSPLLPSTSAHARIRRPSAHKFHATRPRQSSYTPTSRTSFSSFSPRQSSFASGSRTPGSPFAHFPPTPSYLRRTSMTPSHTPTIITILNEPSPIASPPRSASVSSEFALSLGAFETLPQAYQPQPSPPTSPNPSPITYAFPPLSHHSVRSSQRTSTSSSLDRDRRASGPSSPARTRKACAGPTSPGSAPRKAKAFLGVPQSPGGPMSGVGAKKTPAQIEQAKRDRERRKRAEAMRPLPYAKKVEIDAFFGEVTRKPKKPSSTSTSRTKSGSSAEAKAHWNGAASSRNVGGGAGVDHVGDDGTLWMDVEEEQEFTWLLSEIGHGAQPLPHWPIHFSSHLHPRGEKESSISPTSGTFPVHSMSLPTFLEQEELEADKEAWEVADSGPALKVSVLDMPKRDKMAPAPPSSTDSDSDSLSISEVSEFGTKTSTSKIKTKKRPTPLQLPSTLSSSLPKSFTLAPPPPVRAPSAEEGKSEFTEATFRPESPPKEPSSPAYTGLEPERKRVDSGVAFGSLGKMGGGAGGKAGRLVKGWFGGKK